MYFLTVLEARGPQSKCLQGHTPSEACRGMLPGLSVAWGRVPALLASLACGCFTPVLSSEGALPVFLFLYMAASFKDTCLVES